MNTTPSTDLLIIGAGPFGLAMAAHARHLGIEHMVVGEPMHFWRAHMPEGMYLRSDCNWHLDPEAVDTVEAFLHTRGLRPADVTPLSRDLYLEYASWFQARKQIEPGRVHVERLDASDGSRRFRATLRDGGAIEADNILLALGFAHFTHVPEDLARTLPAERVQHTCDFVDFADIRGRRCLIVGGRQSAFEWAALMCEAGAATVHVSHRHDSPAFATSEWEWVGVLVNQLVEDPGWYKRLSQAEKDVLGRRLWAEGRLKLEPWLAARVQRETICLWPNTRVVGCVESGSALEVTLDSPAGPRVLEIDRVVLATGYKVDVARVPLLARGNLLPRLQTDGGMPVLDEHLQSSIPGLFMTSMLAVRDFGPFLAFTVSVRTSAKLVGQALLGEESGAGVGTSQRRRG
jgi:FAD-dependent urate hydroxylase